MPFQMPLVPREAAVAEDGIDLEARTGGIQSLLGSQSKSQFRYLINIKI